MTKTQIQAIIAENNLNMDEWIKLEKYYPIILLAQDGNFYPDDKKTYCRFNSSNEVLEVVYGSYKNNVFVTDSGESDSTKFIPDNFISFYLISGFSEATFRGARGTYFNIPF